MKYVRIAVIVLFIASLGVYGASWVKERRNADFTVPQITSDREVLEVPSQYEEAQLLEGLTAYDEKDGDLTDQIIVGSFSQFVEKGVCNVTYVVFDSSNQPATLTRQLRFSDYRSPRLTLSQPLVFREGEGENAVTYVGADDSLDGNISSLVKLVESDVDYQTAGDYTITVEVTNSFGDVETQNLPVHIIEGSNAALQIQLTSPIVYINPGEEIDPNAYVEQVTDADGNILDSPVVTAESGVDSQREGCYEIHYRAENEQGLAGETWLTVIVRE
ncbi:MAG: hypothetical protein ACOX8H_11165 [Ruminococcus sp.]|jgi:hypothetical protein